MSIVFSQGTGMKVKQYPPHAARVVVVREHQLDGGVALVGLQVRACGADLPVQVAREAVLLHRWARAELRSPARQV